MPVSKVQGGYRWGQSGKVYPTKAQAERQGRAIYASGYQDGGITEVAQGDEESGIASRIGSFLRNVGRGREEPQWKIDLREKVARGEADPALLTMGIDPLDKAAMIEGVHGYGHRFSPAQKLWGAGLATGVGGIVDALGDYPEPPSRETSIYGMLTAPSMPSVKEHWQTGHPWIAGLQSVGAVFPGAAYAKAAYRPVRGAIAEIRTARATSQGDRGITALEETGSGRGLTDLEETGSGRGITSLEETRKTDVDMFARDESGFVSPTIQALIEKAPPNLKGNQIIEWARANANKGVRPKELEFLGLDEFVSANPNATVREAVEGISGNKVTVSRNIRSGGGGALDFERTIPETGPLDGSSLWQHRVDDLKYNLEQGDELTKDELLKVYNYPFPKTAWLQSFDDIPESAIDDILEVFIKEEYSDNPYELLRPRGDLVDIGGDGSGTFAFGNEDIGYSLFVDGERVTDADNIAYSRAEAEIQLQHKLGLDVGEGTQFKHWVDESLPGGENYREVSFNWDNAPETHSIGHIDDENQIAHALIRDRKLADGTPSLHIDELQSDLHTAGSRDGYQLPEKLRIEQNNKIEEFLEGSGISLNPPKTLGRSPTSWKGDAVYLPNDSGRIMLSSIEKIANEFRKGIGSWRDTLTPSVIDELPEMVVEANYVFAEQVDALVESLGVEKIYELADLVKPLTEAGEVPNYPFKDNYHEMVLKNLLLDAAREGKPALSVSGSVPIKARYSDEYSKFYEMLYDRRVPSAMRKLANRYGGEFEQGRLDVDDTFTERDIYPIPESEPLDELQANIIRITPEMRERILEEGIPSFGAGGIVNVTQGDDPSTVDRVRNFMGGINAGRNRP